MHIYVNILGHKFTTYGLLIALGVILANLLALLYVMRKYEHDSPEDFLILEAYTFLGAFTGAKLLYMIISYKDIPWRDMKNIACLNQMMQVGFVFYGGLIGGIISLYLGGKVHHIPAFVYLKHYIFLIPFIHSFGRIGCFEAGCCYGVPYSGYGAVVFPADSLAPSGISLMPVQLIEAVCLMVLAVVILVLQLYRSWGSTVETYLAVYGVLRFILEFFRYDEARGDIGILSISQIISLLLIVMSILWIRRRKKRIGLCGYDIGSTKCKMR